MEIEGYTYSVEHPLVYKWHIKNITSYIKCADNDRITLDSPEFSSGAKIKDSWCLRLTISPEGNYSAKSMVISLRSNNDNRQVRTKTGIYLINNQNQKMEPIDDDFSRQYLHSIEQISTIGSVADELQFLADKLIENSKEFLDNDTLTIGIDLTVYDEHVSINNPINSLKGNKRKMRDDFKDLFVSKRKFDIVIKVGNEKFYAHKFILTTRSSVFDAMFSHNLEEKTTNEINIPDIDSKVFEKLLIFIYTDKVEELENFAEDLLEASDKYLLQGLQEKCEDYLSTNFTIENVLRVMVLADRHSAKRLKEAAITYILVNFTDVKSSEDYKALEKSHPSLAVELLRRYIDNNNK